MIKKEKMRVISSRQVAKDTTEMVLQNTYISETSVPGQFLHIFLDGHTLRRPISIADINKDRQTVTILFKKLGDGTEQLAKVTEGMLLDVLGPSGNGFDMCLEEGDTALLIGGGIGVPPMYSLGKKYSERNIQVVSVLGFQSKEYVFYEEKFKELGKTHIVTNDGSYGAKGFVTDVLCKVRGFDHYYSCGPIPMLKSVKNTLEGKRGSISLEERMGCGIGACYACVVPAQTEEGYKKICSDGPVFDVLEVVL
ncbi:dihydroorotate dehydrogenase electron transfer subunit [Oceanobacillus halophilus]|uniref:Dihydroorotate dehydrogenase B (NAD(+)), electron transfer subunit n=1 Tax=Oceanobacillus halophilus TaxID=930130 RepID=A0A495ACS4_9BACI|nr:dihydroorotate dehydrogenase electron transfer subunit [Oceanobacillus halophilus]RKQ37420.1 dihydroorotate dehydrogenase electron transfer subunit [Oceanobacillus halophilus]